MQEDIALAQKILSQKPDRQRKTSSKGIPVRTFALDPWEVVLASRVWMRGSWCQRELYIVLAHAFWEMTFFGYEYDQVVATQTKEKASRLLDVSHSDKQPSATVTQENRRRSFQFGLTVISQFDAEYFNKTAACVGELNARAQADVCRRIIDLAQRAGLSDSANCS